MSKDDAFNSRYNTENNDASNLKLKKSLVDNVSDYSRSEFLEDSDSDIDIRELASIIWSKKLQVMLVAIICATLSLLFSISLPNIYTASTVLVPSSQSSAGGISALASKYSGLATIAGLDIGTGNSENKIEHALELVKSWPYIEGFVNKYDLKPTFMAASKWDQKTNTLIYDDDIYDSKKNIWLTIDSRSQEPTSFETYEKVVESITFEQDKTSGLITLRVSHYSPYVAKELVNLLTVELNGYFKELDKKEAEKSIEVLANKISETSNADMQQVFYNMIEQHSKTLLMAEVNDQYLIKTLVSVMLPEKKSGPKRFLIVFLSTVFGVLTFIIFIVFRYHPNSEIG
ncbi:Wzz/FepE/Etk N-terminal domain-containing protein [Psychrosphaera aestuarii]|uniref:Wzz/FepE/Etk N-terminal domain-containing protein n=1 Tax=Psychrosphaera aestuarii TaxID=1266052 RepID=UPI001B319160|nr:Wzz/FepE/Etk N-terminal domain-containing protein [Psychrosphaera aestuarii]